MPHPEHPHRDPAPGWWRRTFARHTDDDAAPDGAPGPEPTPDLAAVPPPSVPAVVEDVVAAAPDPVVRPLTPCPHSDPPVDLPAGTVCRERGGRHLLAAVRPRASRPALAAEALAWVDKRLAGRTAFGVRQPMRRPCVGVVGSVEDVLRLLGPTGGNLGPYPVYIAAMAANTILDLFDAAVGPTESTWREATHFRVFLPAATGEAGILMAEGGCDVEIWTDLDVGGVMGMRPNAVSTVLPPQFLSGTLPPGRVAVRELDVMHQPLASDCIADVDLVYLWVDDADPAWQARFEATVATRDPARLAPWATDPGRFTNLDELRYSLRSVHQFAPWVRHIWLVTDQQRPTWLVDTPGLTVVDHRDVFPADASLPTFNSHALSSVVHRIEGLSEHFLLMNDDVLFGWETTKEQFFTAAGQPVVYPSTRETGLGGPDTHLRTPAVAGLRIAELLLRDYGRRSVRSFWHVPHAFTRSAMADLEQRYATEFSATRNSPFRSPDDLEPVALHHWTGLVEGRAVAGSRLRYAYVDVSMPELPDTWRAARARKSHVICVNLGALTDASHAQRVRRRTVPRLERLLPFLSPYEIDPPPAPTPTATDASEVDVDTSDTDTSD